MNKKRRLEELERVAKEGYDCNSIHIDPLLPTHVSEGSHGIWVRAWVYIENATLKEEGITNPASAN